VGTVARSLAADTFIKLTRASESVSKRIHTDLAEAGLTFTQFAVLEALYVKGPMCQRSLSEKVLSHSSGNMTLVVDNLEKRGLVERERRAADRRMMHVRLTPAGLELISAFLPTHVERIRVEMGVVTDEELVQLGQLLRKLGLCGDTKP
jgi:MarR family transcriptional regulator, 2-MHQ and catechol-resistance regulon repressor